MSATGNEIDASTAADLLRSCHNRRLDTEGIPMVLALVDERRPPTASARDAARREGTHLADLLDTYARLLVPQPDFRPADEGSLITVLQVLSSAHFDPPATDRQVVGPEDHRDSAARAERP